MAELPTLSELQQLPLRSIVAYALRCARRAHAIPKTPEVVSQSHDTVELLEAAEKICHGLQSCFEFGSAASKVGKLAAGTEHFGRAFSAAHTAFAANAKDCAGAAIAAVNAAAAAAHVMDNVSAYNAASRADFERLADLVAEDTACPEGTIDPSEQGPLGPLWPQADRHDTTACC